MGSRPEQLAREARFWELLGQGMSRHAACDAVGVHPRQGYRWFKAARGKNPFERAARSGRYSSEEERLRIADLRLAGVGIRQIAAELERAPSTISREPAQNSSRNGDHRPYAAEKRCRVRARRPKPRKLDQLELALQVELRLGRNWSPEQIRDDLTESFPDRPEMHVSHETIYQSLFVQGRGHLRADLHKHLRTGRAIRRHRGKPRPASWSKIRDMILISERPAEADDRSVPGHWEGDLIVGINARSAIGTLVERTTRYVMLLHLPSGHSSDAVRDAMIPTIQTLPEHLRRTLTWDQGTELARHKDIALGTDLTIYFCDPPQALAARLEREHQGLLRHYFPSPPTSPSTARNGSTKSLPNSTADPARHWTTAPRQKHSNSYCQTRNNHPLQRPLETAIDCRTVIAPPVSSRELLLEGASVRLWSDAELRGVCLIADGCGFSGRRAWALRTQVPSCRRAPADGVGVASLCGDPSRSCYGAARRGDRVTVGSVAAAAAIAKVTSPVPIAIDAPADIAQVAPPIAVTIPAP